VAVKLSGVAWPGDGSTRGIQCLAGMVRHLRILRSVGYGVMLTAVSATLILPMRPDN